MHRRIKTALIIGSGPNAVDAAAWDRDCFDAVVVINNAWRIRTDWSHLIHPDDFPIPRRPLTLAPGQKIIRSHHYIPSQNTFGGIVYAGGTMAFTAGYWAVDQLRPDVLAFVGCDMVYPRVGKTHFYGKGAADPLRDDITLQDLEAKSARLATKAAKRGTVCVNLSKGPSRLVFPRASVGELAHKSGRLPNLDVEARDKAEAMENALDYRAEDGRYWRKIDAFDSTKLAEIDAQWRRVWQLCPHSADCADPHPRLIA